MSILDNAVELKPHACPDCGQVHDRALNIGGKERAEPRQDDFSICAYCGEVAQYNADLTLRKPTREELVKLPIETLASVLAGRYAVLKIIEARKAKENDSA